MNKYTILTLACFSILPCITSAAETYVEYVHITSDNLTLELAEGETAILVANSKNLTIVDKVTLNGKPMISETYGWYSQYLYHDVDTKLNPNLFVGFATLEWDESTLKYGRFLTFKVTRIAETTASNDDSTTTPDPQATDYLSMDGWLFFTEFPWVYSSRNDSWYYLTAADDKLFAFNENIGGTNWMTLNSDN